jgi:histone H3/H4
MSDEPQNEAPPNAEGAGGATPTVSGPVGADTPEEIAKAKEFLLAHNYTDPAAEKLVREYGAKRILSDAASEAAAAAEEKAKAEAEQPTELVPGRHVVTVYDYDSKKKLPILEKRDTGNTLDLWVKTK